MDVTQARERHLLRRARSGDPDAWEEVYRRVYPRLFAYARRRLSTTEQAEDAVSEAVIRAMHKIADYQPSGVGLDGWIFGIARHVVLETYRAGSRVTPVDPADLVDATDPALPDQPVEAVLADEERSLVAQAFRQLSGADRELLELRVIVGLGSEQVGALTGRRPGAVRTAQSRALSRLRTAYEGLMA